DMTRAGRDSGRIIPSVLCAFASAHSSGRVRIIGEHSWVGHAVREYPACGQHESLINLAFAGRPVTMLCPYDADRVGPRTLADAQACHPLLIDVDGERVSATYAPERFIADYNQSAPPATALSLTFNADNVALARQFASDQATRLGLDGDHSEFLLIVGELTANSLVHGEGNGTLYVWTERGYLVCEVRGAGRIVDPLVAHPVAPNQINSRDLLLANYLSDLVRQHSCPQGIATRVYVKLSPSGEPFNDPSESIPAPRTRRAPLRSTPLPWQTYEALHAAERFGRYLPQDITASPERPAAASAERSKDWRSVEPVLEALTAVETLARVVDRWRARLVRLARTRGA
ncbi:MAG: anti-sigma factor RsbA family regulatory protein, partial [Pseudonocardiaceae bacterium]